MDIVLEVVEDGNIEQCRELCDELMVYQKKKAKIHPECFDVMNFETRMKKSYERAFRKQVVVAKADGRLVGYVFSTIDPVSQADKNTFPDWAPKEGLGFYPEWVEVPQNIGCLNNLYLREEYRGMGLGKALFDQSIKWLEGYPDTHLTFVFISNGNDDAMNFYLQNGFSYSHKVFGGFISAAVKHKER